MDLSKTKIHHSILLLTTVLYSAVVISFGKYEITKVIPFIIYPAIMFAFIDAPIKPILKKLILIEPLILGIGILNPFFENQTFQVFDLSLSYGWLSLGSLVLRGTMILLSTLILAESIQLEEALIGLKMPPIFVTQLALTYRYIGLMTHEIKTVMLAYSLRSQQTNRINIKHMGSILGHFFIRTLDKANRVHHAMMLRGFDGTNHRMSSKPIPVKDWLVFILWTILFFGLRVLDVSNVLGQWLMGGEI